MQKKKPKPRRIKPPKPTRNGPSAQWLKRGRDLIDQYEANMKNNAPRSSAELAELRALFRYHKDAPDPSSPQNPAKYQSHLHADDPTQTTPP